MTSWDSDSKDDTNLPISIGSPLAVIDSVEAESDLSLAEPAPPEEEHGVYLLITGIQEELDSFLRLHPCRFDRKYRLYRSEQWNSLFCVSAGPGLRKPGRLKRLLMQLNPDVIVNAGLTGLLDERSDLPIGHRMRLGSIVDARDGIVFPGGPGKEALVTVSEPVFEPLAKMNLFLKFETDACDMEAARLLAMIGSLENVSIRAKVHFIKVVGDRPDDYELFQYEEKIRSWKRFSHRKKLKTMIQFPGGFFRLRSLQKKKKEALDALGAMMEESMKRILESGGNTDTLDSLFIPH